MADLDKLVAHYGEVDNQVKTLKKELDSDKVTLKNLMREQKLDSHSAGGYTVTYSIRENTEIDERKMLEILKKDWENRYGKGVECPYIQTVEVIDTDKLEAVLYAGELPKEVIAQLDACQIKKPVEVLGCKKNKGAN